MQKILIYSWRLQSLTSINIIEHSTDSSDIKVINSYEQMLIVFKTQNRELLV